MSYLEGTVLINYAIIFGGWSIDIKYPDLVFLSLKQILMVHFNVIDESISNKVLEANNSNFSSLNCGGDGFSGLSFTPSTKFNCFVKWHCQLHFNSSLSLLTQNCSVIASLLIE